MSEFPEKAPLAGCPGCGKEVTWDVRNKYRPFCSERCKTMDLGQWAAERYRVAGEPINQETADSTAGKD